MSAKPLLIDTKFESQLPNLKVYVIQFPNPFDSSIKSLEESITYRSARKQLFEIFKTSLQYQRPQDFPVSSFPVLELQNTLSAEYKSKLDSEAVPEMIKKKVIWLYGDENGSDKITKREFFNAVVSSVLYTIEYELGLKYSLLESRDKDEVFCEIYADEAWLENRAQATGYRLQLRPTAEDGTKAEREKFPFKSTPPYAKFEIPSNFKEARDIFKHYDKDEKETHQGSLFTYNDRVRLIRSSLNTKLDLHRMKELKISIEDFCLHSEIPLENLKNTWANLSTIFSPQPLRTIRNYFGEKIALYFAWMEVYKNLMVFAGLIGLSIQIFLFLGYFGKSDRVLSHSLQVFYALFLAFWAAAFDRLWTRREKILAWEWGTTSFNEEEEQRGEFKGKISRDPVSNTMKRRRIGKVLYSLKKFISYTVILVAISSALAVMLGIMAARSMLQSSINQLGLVLAGALNALQIRIMNLLYDKLAVLLNDWENHETETEYNNRLAVKIFVFRFFNSYSSLFFLAYFCDEAHLGVGQGSCMDFLSIQLAAIFFVSFLLNIVEISIPYLLMKRRLSSEDSKIQQLSKTDDHLRLSAYPVEREAKRESYESPLFDYIEMIIEFGYVVLFGSALPVLPLLLLLEIVFEIRIDAWKICNVYKRADPHRSEDIGVFRDIIVIMGYVGATNNSGLIIFTSGIVGNLLSVFYGIVSLPTTFDYLIAFVVLEHVVIVGMFLISVMISDMPEVVEKGLIWSERIINERLYQKATGFKVNVMKNLIEGVIERGRGENKFLLMEDELIYTEN